MLTILCAAITTYLLRILPFLSKKWRHRPSETFTKVIEYAVSFIMGNIIFNAAFHYRSISQLLNHFDLRNILVIITLILAFVICKLTGSVLKSLLGAMGLFFGSIILF